MHGLGADGNDFVPIVGELGLDGGPAVRFVFPHAPMRPVTINNGYVMRAWYDISSGDLEGRSRADERGVRESQAQIDALIEREKARGVPPAGSCSPASRRAGRWPCTPGCATRERSPA